MHRNLRYIDAVISQSDILKLESDEFVGASVTAVSSCRSQQVTVKRPYCSTWMKSCHSLDAIVPPDIPSG